MKYLLLFQGKNGKANARESYVTPILPLLLLLQKVMPNRHPQGNRKRGRPRKSWRRSVIKGAGRSWNELRFLAADRQKWKGLIDNLCS